jgi:sarcosine oxidase, subunit gamma
MKTLSPRTSPVYDQLQQIDGEWREINGMRSLYTIPNEDTIAQRLGIADLSYLTRFGVKGAGAAAWLEAQEIPIPNRPNSWTLLQEGGLIARLGVGEYLIESPVASRLAQGCQNLPAKVYPVLRQDLAIALCGEAINELLLQTCNVNFQALPQSSVILTSMIGVSVIVIPGEIYRIWCDGTFGAYFWETLVAIAQELGGSVVGAKRVI